MTATEITVTLFLSVFSQGVFSDDVLRRQIESNGDRGRIIYPNEFPINYYHHHPDFHNNGGNSKRPRQDNNFSEVNSTTPSETNSAPMEIPLDFAQMINEYNISEVIDNFVEGHETYNQPGIENRFGEEPETERKVSTIAKAAGCMPELKSVQIASSDDPSILYIPQCTRIERCGGCCSHTLLSCQPIENETITYQVMKTQYTGGKKLKYLGKEIVLVEKHIKCKCDCKIKPQDCNRYQEYRQSQCLCSCINTDEEKKCYKNVKKLWNPELCACQCREVMACSTGYSFDNSECRCMQVPMKRRFASFVKGGYVSEEIPAAPSFDSEF